ncbi:hypothetical protein ABPG74_000892 [Tetrahymena malaccensis]
MANREYDYLIKLVIIGNSSVGKSSVLLRFSDDQFSESYLTTIGVDFRFKTLNIDGRKVKLQIWDTAGQERFRTITNAYYKGADGIVLVYDITNSTSFEDIERFWLNEVESYAEKDVELLLLGNKSDLSDQRQVETNMVSEYAEKKHMDFYETSAKTSDQIEQAFLAISKRLMSKKDAKLAEKKKRPTNSKKGTGQSSESSQKSSSTSATSSSNANGSQQPAQTNENISLGSSSNQTKKQNKINLGCCQV